jgi:hypothetical protein
MHKANGWVETGSPRILITWTSRGGLMGRILGLILIMLLSVDLCRAGDESYVQQLREMASQEDGESQFALALLYEHGGQGVERDPQQALTLFLQAGQGGIAGACLYLGIKYENGSGVARNLVEAGRWYCCAAREGWAMAQFFLAGLYEQGKGVKQDKILALAWYGLAKEQGHPAAVEAFSRLTGELSEAEQKKGLELRVRLQFSDCTGF